MRFRWPGCFRHLLDQRLAVAAAAETAVSAARARGRTSPSTPSVLDGSRAASSSTAKRLTLADGWAWPGRHRHRARKRQGGREADRGRVPRRTVYAAACASTRRRPGVGCRRQPSSSRAAASRPWPALPPARPRASGTIGWRHQVLRQGYEPARRAFGAAGQRHARARRRQAGDAVAGRHRQGGRTLRSRLDPDSLPGSSGRAWRRAWPPASCSFRPVSSRSPTGGCSASRSQSTPPRGVRRLGGPRPQDAPLDVGLAPGAARAPPGHPTSLRCRRHGDLSRARSPRSASLEPRIDSEALERELAVRRMERDVEELERLRRLDEARRREEAERQRRQLDLQPRAADAGSCRPRRPGSAAGGTGVAGYEGARRRA